MLSDHEIEEELARFTYKPGWKFSIYAPLLPSATSSRAWLKIDFEVEDTYRPGHQTRVGMRRPLLPYYIDADHFAHWLVREIDRAEQHETREFLKRDGVMIFDPHRGEVPA